MQSPFLSLSPAKNADSPNSRCDICLAGAVGNLRQVVMVGAISVAFANVEDLALECK